MFFLSHLQKLGRFNGAWPVCLMGVVGVGVGSGYGINNGVQEAAVEESENEYLDRSS